MYAIEATVRKLCRNRQTPLTTADIESFAALIDDELDVLLGGVYYFPLDASGDAVDVPSQVKSIATYLTAALIESDAYAQNEAGGQIANPYASRLDRIGRTMLGKVLDGSSAIPGLTHVGQLASAGAKKTFAPVHGLRSSGGGRSW